jgi:hypothetical protein
MKKRFGLQPAALLLVLAALACNTLLPPRPTVDWDRSAASVVLSATYCCGLVPQYYAENYLPDVLIFGDGRIVWVEDLEGGARRVNEGVLSEAELAALLQSVVDAGFFGWADNYANYNVTDLPNKCLHVRLAEASKSVCEYYEGAPAAFHTLYREAASGAGTPAAEFVPSEGRLSVFPTVASDNLTPEDYVVWDPAVAGISLSQVTPEQIIDGNALALAWRAVNRSSWTPLVREGDDYYYVVVGIPGLNAP